MSEWKKVKIGEFLFERKGLIDPNDSKLFSLKKIEKIDFSEGKIFLCDYSPTKTKQIIVKKGDFVFSGLNIEKGAVAINDFDQDLVVSANYSTCEVDYSKIDQEFLEIFIKSSSFKELLIDNLKKDYGFTRPKHLINLEILLPSVSQQKQIARKLKLSEEKQKALKSQIENQKTYLKNLRKQILQDAIQGKLTEDWRKQNPDAQPASELLKIIKKEKEKLIAEKKLKKAAKIPNSITHRNIKIPKEWGWIKADELLFITKLAGFEYTKYIKLKDHGDVPVVRAQNVRPLFIKKDSLKYIDLETSLLLERCALTKNALLVTFIGAGIGDVAFFDEYQRWHLAPNVAKMEVFDNCSSLVNLKFLNYFLLSNYGQKEIFKHIKATAQPSLSMGTIRDIDFIFPPISEQKSIVAKLETLMQKLDEAEKSIERSLETSKLLTKAILAEAFSNKETNVPKISQLFNDAQKSCEEEGFVDIKKILMSYGISLIKDQSLNKAQIRYDNDNDRFFIHTRDLNDNQSIAHEVVHYFIDNDEIKKQGIIGRKDDYSLSGKDAKREIEVENLAAEVLMPEKFVILLVENKGITKSGFIEDKIVRNLAKQLKVSEPSMSYRLNNLGYKTNFKNYYNS